MVSKKIKTCTVRYDDLEIIAALARGSIARFEDLHYRTKNFDHEHGICRIPLAGTVEDARYLQMLRMREANSRVAEALAACGDAECKDDTD